MKFKLDYKTKVEEYNVSYYSNKYYKLVVAKTNNKLDDCYVTTLETEENINIIIPSLLIERNIYDRKIEDIKINVTGLGYVDSEEIEMCIKGYKVALETVKELKELLKE